MEQIMKSLVFLAFCLQLSSAATHSMQYILTGVTQEVKLPEYTAVGLVDGEPFVHYDSDIRRMIPKTEWIKKVVSYEAGYWDRETTREQGWQETFKVDMGTLMQRFNQTKGVHTWQLMYGCELNDDDGSKRGYMQFGYDGNDFTSLDLNTGTWTAPVPQAVITKHKWEADVGFTNYWRNTYLQNECIEWIKKYVGYGRDTLERKVPPKVSLFQKDSSSPVVCHATDFFPKSVMISWQKNGEDLYENVELRETVPNPDGTFQKRSTLTISPEELDKHKYTCAVQHGGLEKELVLKVSDRRVLSGDGGSMGIIIGAVVAVLVLISCVGVFIWKKQRTGKHRELETDSKSSGSGEDNSKGDPLLQKTDMQHC